MELDRTLIERVLPAEAGEASWTDVLQRADRARRRRTRQASALLVVAAVLVAVTSAFGGRIVHLFQGEPAPPNVQESAREMVPPDLIEQLMGRQSPRVLAERTHGLIRLRTAAGPFFLWGAPMSDGGRCVVLTYGALDVDHPISSGNCLSRSDTPQPQIVVGNDNGFPGVGQTLVAFGLVPRGTASAELHTRDGDTIPLQLVEGGFLTALRPGTKLRDAVARGANGNVIARQSLVFRRPRGCCRKVPVPPGAAYKPLFTVNTSIGVVTLKTAVAYPGCYEVDMPVVDGHSSGSGTCVSPAHPLPSLVQLGVMPLKGDVDGPVLIAGTTREDVRRLELRFDDGTALPLPLHDGYYMAELPHGNHPTVFGARLADGREATEPFDGRPSKRRP